MHPTNTIDQGATENLPWCPWVMVHTGTQGTVATDYAALGGFALERFGSRTKVPRQRPIED